MNARKLRQYVYSGALWEVGLRELEMNALWGQGKVFVADEKRGGSRTEWKPRSGGEAALPRDNKRLLRC